MADMDDFDVEIQDEKDSTPENNNGSVSTAGTPVLVIPSSGNPLTSAIVINPDKGPNKNDKQDLLFISFDGGVTYLTLKRGSSISITASFASLKLDSNNNGTNYEIVMTS